MCGQTSLATRPTGTSSVMCRQTSLATGHCRRLGIATRDVSPSGQTEANFGHGWVGGSCAVGKYHGGHGLVAAVDAHHVVRA